MRSQIHSIIAQSLLICLSLAFMSVAHAGKIAVTEADPNVAEVEPDAVNKPDAGKDSSHPASRRES